MSNGSQLQFKRGNTATSNAFTGAEGELFVDTTKKIAVVHDGSTAGGSPLVSETGTQTISNKTIGSDLLPSADSAYDLGSSSFKWKSLYLSGNTIFLGDASISASGTSITLPAGSTIGETGTVLDSDKALGLLSGGVGISYNDSTGEIAFNVSGNGTAGQMLISDGDGSLSWADAGGGGLFEEDSSGVWSSPSITRATLNGDLIVTGDVTSSSDERHKENIIQVTNALDMVNQMNGVFYNFKNTPEKRSVGVIAQDVEKVLPEVVYDGHEYKSVAYGNIVGVLIEAIKELRKEVKDLKDGI